MVESAFLLSSPPELRPWVRQVWYSRGRLESRRETVLATLTTDIVANLGDAITLARGRGEGRIVGTTVTGLITAPLELEHPAVHEALGIRLSPRGLRAVLGVPPAEAANRVVAWTDVVGTVVDELVDRCRLASGPIDRIAAAVAWLRERIGRSQDAGDSLVDWARARLDETRGRIRVADLQRESGFSATRFTQRFRAELGVTPKQYGRLARFQEALDRLTPGIDLGRLAADLGYSDQSHMNRDFRQFAETTPTDVLARRYPTGLTLAGVV